MKLVKIHTLLDAGPFTDSKAWARVEREVREAVAAVVWPPGSGAFTIRPERKGNGVRPIKEGFVAKLEGFGWKREQRFPRMVSGETAATLPGKFDAMLALDELGLPPFVIEWETGNISSSHRAMNKIALALKMGRVCGGILVLPSRPLYRFLTDRIGNYEELEPYLSLYTELRVEHGYFGVVVVEHDATSPEVPRIEKGTDGRALV